MDVVRAIRSKEKSPDIARIQMQPRTMKPFRKVQVLYYLCRNGQLEHPHFMEVTHLANQHLRLKDIIDRLTALRGKGMPLLFSWSCKRSYKNGYVWNDLSENDVIYASEGSEYVLKGSEIIEGSAERFQQLQLSNRQQTPEPNFHPRRKLLDENQHKEQEDVVRDMREEDEDEEVEEGKVSDSNSNKSYFRCSKGVSTDEIVEHESHPKGPNNPTEIILDEDASPPSTSSTISDKARDSLNGNSSQRFEDCDGVTERSEPVTSRSSVLLQLIACGSSVAVKGRNNNVPFVTKSTTTTTTNNNNLHKGVLCKTAAKMIMEDDEISYMSQNPRFGNPQSEEKEYFSGSIVDSMTVDRVATEPALKKSSSFNEERSSKAGLEEAASEAERMKKKDEKGLKVKCIPRKKFHSKQSKP